MARCYFNQIHIWKSGHCGPASGHMIAQAGITLLYSTCAEYSYSASALQTELVISSVYSLL